MVLYMCVVHTNSKVCINTHNIMPNHRPQLYLHTSMDKCTVAMHAKTRLKRFFLARNEKTIVQRAQIVEPIVEKNPESQTVNMHAIFFAHVLITHA